MFYIAMTINIWKFFLASGLTIVFKDSNAIFVGTKVDIQHKALFLRNPLSETKYSNENNRCSGSACIVKHRLRLLFG